MRNEHYLRLFTVSFLLLFCGCQEAILHDLDEVTANRAKVILARNGITSQKIREGALWRITVKSAQATDALDTLERTRALGAQAERTVEQSSRLIPSREERAHFVERTLSYQLEETLERYRGVLEARVHLRLAPRAEFRLNQKQHTESASILLVVSESVEIDIDQVRRIVSGAVGINSEFVTVVLSTEENGSSGEVHEALTMSSKVDIGEVKQGLVGSEDAVAGGKHWAVQVYDLLSQHGIIASVIGVIFFGIIALRVRKAALRKRCSKSGSARDLSKVPPGNTPGNPRELFSEALRSPGDATYRVAPFRFVQREEFDA